MSHVHVPCAWQVKSFELALLETMIAHQVPIAHAMQPPKLPDPFLYRPFEAGTPAQTARPTSAADEEEDANVPTIDDGTRFLMRVACSLCRQAHWLPIAMRWLWVPLAHLQHLAARGEIKRQNYA